MHPRPRGLDEVAADQPARVPKSRCNGSGRRRLRSHLCAPVWPFGRGVSLGALVLAWVGVVVAITNPNQDGILGPSWWGREHQL